jgi:hypothetical protein
MALFFKPNATGLGRAVWEIIYGKIILRVITGSNNNPAVGDLDLKRK